MNNWQVQGKPFVLKKASANGSIRSRSYVNVKCACGSTSTITTSALKSNRSTGCKTCQYKKVSLANRRHGQSQTALYGVWASMVGRCHNRNDRGYQNYGGRGIAVCKRWRKFQNFQQWAASNGYKRGLCIERKNNDEGYNPGNCLWATRKEQQNNTRRNVWVVAFGERKTLTQWVEDKRCKLRSCATLRWRIKKGWNPEQAITVPPTLKR